MKNKIVGAFIVCGLEPQGIIGMNFNSLKQAQEHVKNLIPKPSHWCMSGMCNDNLTTVYEEKDEAVLVNKFEERLKLQVEVIE